MIEENFFEIKKDQSVDWKDLLICGFDGKKRHTEVYPDKGSELSK